MVNLGSLKGVLDALLHDTKERLFSVKALLKLVVEASCFIDVPVKCKRTGFLEVEPLNVGFQIYGHYKVKCVLLVLTI